MYLFIYTFIYVLIFKNVFIYSHVFSRTGLWEPEPDSAPDSVLQPQPSCLSFRSNQSKSEPLQFKGRFCTSELDQCQFFLPRWINKNDELIWFLSVESGIPFQYFELVHIWCKNELINNKIWPKPGTWIKLMNERRNQRLWMDEKFSLV